MSLGHIPISCEKCVSIPSVQKPNAIVPPYGVSLAARSGSRCSQSSSRVDFPNPSMRSCVTVSHWETPSSDPFIFSRSSQVYFRSDGIQRSFAHATQRSDGRYVLGAPQTAAEHHQRRGDCDDHPVDRMNARFRDAVDPHMRQDPGEKNAAARVNEEKGHEDRKADDHEEEAAELEFGLRQPRQEE